jgi:hypothetical protein
VNNNLNHPRVPHCLNKLGFFLVALNLVYPNPFSEFAVYTTELRNSAFPKHVLSHWTDFANINNTTHLKIDIKSQNVEKYDNNHTSTIQTNMLSSTLSWQPFWNFQNGNRCKTKFPFILQYFFI